MPATDSHDGLAPGAAPGAAPPSPDATQVTGGISYGKTDVFQPGEVIGGSYQVLHALGQGAMGMVYKVKHVNMGVEYALKLLSTDYSNANAMLRFQNEAQALAKLNHPNVIAVYNFGLHQDRMPFYVMDFLSGEDLLDKLEAHGPMPVQVALPVFIEVCAGLSYAHRKGILHRDVKPANFVMLNVPDVRGARVKVVDFGLVKFSEEIRPDVQKLTAMGEVCGSPSYMSPEQSSGQKIDPRSDIYSLGCSLFQAVTGKLPFRGRNSTETMMMQHEAEVPTLASQGDGRTYPQDLERVVAKMMAKAPMDRYQSMELVAQDLRNIMEGNPLGTPPLTPMPEFGTGTYSATSPSGRGDFSRTAGPIAGANMERSQSFKRDENLDDRSRGSDMNMATTARFRKSDNRHPGKTTGAQVEDRGEPIPIKKVVAFIAVAFLIVGAAGFGTYFTWRAMQPSPKSQMKVSSQTSIDSERVSESIPDLDPDSTKARNIVSELKFTTAKYFSSTITEGGKEYIEFDFPTKRGDVNLGYIAESFNVRNIIAGKMRYRKGQRLWFVPMPLTASVPHFYDKFRPGDFVGVFIPSGFATDEMFNQAVQMPGITYLNLDNCFELTKSIMPAISKLHLQVLHANLCPVNGSHLAKARFWQDLRFLDISMCKNVTPILKELSGSKNLQVLSIADDKLSSNDYDLISTLSDLRVLNISNNRVAPRDLRALSRLPKLVELCAYNTSMNDSAYVDELCKLHQLTIFGLCSGYMRAQDVELLKRRRPDLRVDKYESMSMKKMLMTGTYGVD